MPSCVIKVCRNYKGRLATTHNVSYHRTMPFLVNSGQFSLEEEYKKDTGIKPGDIAEMRASLSTQPHLPAEHITDLDLILAFHCSHRSSAVAKQVLDLNLTLRTLFTNLFKDRYLDKETIRSLELCLFTPLNVRTVKNQKVYYARLLDYDPKNLNFANEVKAFLMTLDFWQYKEGTWPGLVIVIDLDRMAFGHLARLDLQTMQQFLYFLQEGLLAKLDGMHFINAPSFMDKLLMLMKPFMKKELMDVLFIHQIGAGTLEEHVPMSALPKDAGGDWKTFEQCRDDMIALLKENEEFFTAENKKRVVESRRPGKPKTITDIFGGVEGSFKKLDID